MCGISNDLKATSRCKISLNVQCKLLLAFSETLWSCPRHGPNHEELILNHKFAAENFTTLRVSISFFHFKLLLSISTFCFDLLERWFRHDKFKDLGTITFSLSSSTTSFSPFPINCIVLHSAKVSFLFLCNLSFYFKPAFSLVDAFGLLSSFEKSSNLETTHE